MVKIMRESRETVEYGCIKKEGNIYEISSNAENLGLDIKGQWHIISY